MNIDSTPGAVLAIDIGGTKLAAGIWHAAAEKMTQRRELLTLAAEGAEAVFERTVGLARMILADYALPVTAVGVAGAGQYDSKGRVVFATGNLPGWTGMPLGQRLEAALGRPVFVANDANCFALAETTVGAGRGYRDLFLVAVGTGIGGGIVLGEQVYAGRLGGAGEVGHMRLVTDGGRACTCGLTGCLEAYTSSSVMAARAGYKNILALAAAFQDDPKLPAVLEAAAWLGQGLGVISAVLAPELILIGGSAPLLGQPYLERVHQSFIANSMLSCRAIPLAFTQLGADSGLIGAGILASTNSPVSSVS